MEFCTFKFCWFPKIPLARINTSSTSACVGRGKLKFSYWAFQEIKSYLRAMQFCSTASVQLDAVYPQP